MPPTTSWPTRSGARASTAARSTPRGTRRRRAGIGRTRAAGIKADGIKAAHRRTVAPAASRPRILESLFGQAFRGGGFNEAGSAANRRGGDVQYSLTVDFLDAARGAVRRLTLPDGRTLDVTIPAGLRDGHVLRLKGQGRPGRGTGAAGDALVEISVAPHPYFRREGDDIVLRLPVTLREAVLGAVVDVPTLGGRVRLTIPPGSGRGTRLRLRGRGIAGGHQHVELDVMLPVQPDPGFADLLRDWTPAHPFDPRAALNAEMQAEKEAG